MEVPNWQTVLARLPFSQQARAFMLAGLAWFRPVRGSDISTGAPQAQSVHAPGAGTRETARGSEAHHLAGE